ncbi:VOC family protein [Aquabacterium sp. A7-Y]|uniref:VOC family protein n=1 Tax=Aquabacterium sp. A7-Y TaxID=1349605 RepID=UPI00223DA550|nr:VOC family protein [Aquabacterium sp. A7-Y]MCW7537138.1 VOC family protein [Aquabacterium sp. A7-Y]
MAEIHGIDHIQLPIPFGASPRARAFYQGLLGLTEVRHPELDRPGVLRFSLGWQRLDLSEGSYTGVAPQAHIALRVAGVARLADALQATGQRVDRSALNDGRVFVEDPFGNRLELIEPPSNSFDTQGEHHVRDLHLAV